jgi:hypothetical protein
MAAESYFQGIDMQSAIQIRARLLLGNNNTAPQPAYMVASR